MRRRWLVVTVMWTFLGCHRAEAPREKSDPKVTPTPAPAAPAMGPATTMGPPPAMRPAPAPDMRPAPAMDARDDGGKVYRDRRLRLGKPHPLTRLTQGDAPRVALQYRLQKGEAHTWLAKVDQRTVLRNEKQCPAKGVSTKPPRRTLVAGYQVQVHTAVTDALPKKLTLATRFSDAKLTLPPSLTDQRALLTSLVHNARYTVKMSRQGRVKLFELGKLASRDLKGLLKRLRSPLSSLQPVLPKTPVGANATWQHRRRLPMVEPGGHIVTVLDARYRVVKLEPADKPAKVFIEVRGAITMRGKLMGKEFRGDGQNRARLVLDARSGVLLRAKGETRMCTSVLGQTSTNRTRYEQKLLKATAAPALRPAAMAPEPRPRK